MAERRPAKKQKLNTSSAVIHIRKGPIVFINAGEEQVQVLADLIKRDNTDLTKALAVAESIAETNRKAQYKILRWVCHSQLDPLIIDRPDDDPLTVATYVHWLYRSTSALTTLSDQHELARLYLFGESIKHPGFCMAVIARMKDIYNDRNDKADTMPDIHTIDMVYAESAFDSSLRKFMVDAWRKNGKAGSLADIDDNSELPRAFLLDLARSLLQQCESKKFRPMT